VKVKTQSSLRKIYFTKAGKQIKPGVEVTVYNISWTEAALSGQKAANKLKLKVLL